MAEKKQIRWSPIIETTIEAIKKVIRVVRWPKVKTWEDVRKEILKKMEEKHEMTRELREWSEKLQEAQTEEEIKQAEEKLGAIFKKWWPLVFTPEELKEMKKIAEAILKDTKRMTKSIEELIEMAETEKE